MTDVPNQYFVLEDFTPAYLNDAVRASLPGQAESAVELLRECRVCPRACGVDRLNIGEERTQTSRLGVCRTGRYARISSAFAHFGEEDCLVGSRGSGTIFFSRCNLRCVFCQNWDISQAGDGRECPPQAIAEIMLSLQEQGCHNINLVTPEHVVPQVVEAIVRAIGQGLHLPIVYNTSAYDSLESLRQLEGLIDIYMPDFKLWSPQRGRRYLGAENYSECARDAIAEMHRQVGDLKLSQNGLACRGLLVRHLVMPGLLDETAAILEWLAREISPDMFVNIMGQYRPAYCVGRSVGGVSAGVFEVAYPEINRCCSPDEIEVARRIARQAGLWRLE